MEVIGTPIIKRRRTDSGYVLFSESAYVDNTQKNVTTNFRHEHLNHVSYNKLKKKMNNDILRGLSQVYIRIDIVCAGCQFGKAHQLAFNESENQFKIPLNLIHSYVFGLAKQSSLGGIKYMVTFIDNFSNERKVKDFYEVQ